MLSKVLSLLLIVSVSMSFPRVSTADPKIGDLILPPASFTYVDDRDGDLLSRLGLEPGPAFCYDADANAILITAPARAKAECELDIMYRLEKQKAKYEFDIGRLTASIEALQQKHEEINAIKDQEITKLTTAALERPNDYSFWWASGGFATGALTVVLILVIVN